MPNPAFLPTGKEHGLGPIARTTGRPVIVRPRSAAEYTPKGTQKGDQPSGAGPLLGTHEQRRFSGASPPMATDPRGGQGRAKHPCTPSRRRGDPRVKDRRQSCEMHYLGLNARWRPETPAGVLMGA